MAQKQLLFGVYAGSDVGLTHMKRAASKADDSSRIQAMLDQLHDDQPFIVRGYVHYLGDGNMGNITPERVEQYTVHGRKLDMVLCRQADEADMSGWLDFISERIAYYGAALANIQITEEPNVTDEVQDGRFAGVKEAVIAGVVHAKQEIRRRGLDVKVGFNAALSFGPQATFWSDLAKVATPEFYDALDYVGLDFFPDVFRPIEQDKQASIIEYVLRKFREQDLSRAGITQDIAIRITENGWPTSSERSEAQQAEMLKRTIATIQALATELNITHIEWFALRDFDSTKDDTWYQWGLLRDDYSPKPAFGVYQDIIKGV